MHALRTSIKNLTKDIKNLFSLKYLCEYENTIKETYKELFDTKTLVKIEIVKYYIDITFTLAHLLKNRCRKFMNPQFTKEEIKYFKNLIEMQLEIIKVVLKEHTKQEGNFNCDSEEIKNLEKVQERQQRRINKCNTTLGIRKKVGRL